MFVHVQRAFAIAAILCFAAPPLHAACNFYCGDAICNKTTPSPSGICGTGICRDTSTGCLGCGCKTYGVLLNACRCDS